jgi:5-(carboxyamino)imidazole ribonucleotide synthase
VSAGVLEPGATLGVLGGGQLGRMFAVAARRLGYRVAVWSDERGAPALAIADVAVTAGYGDSAAFEHFVASVDAITVEFENIPGDLLAALAARRTLRPGYPIIAAFQQRQREKRTLASLGLPLAPHRFLCACRDRGAAQQTLSAALAEIELPAVLKTAGFGYDGKGQVLLTSADPLPEAALTLVQTEDTVLEAFVPLAAELSVVVARDTSGKLATFPVAENHHVKHILDLTLLPARIPTSLADRAAELAAKLATGVDLVGLLCVELFLTRTGELLVNEVAPRPHNSGHITLEACSVDQFEQQVRALAGLPLGRPEVLQPGAMVNLLGDLWFARPDAAPPAWGAALTEPGVRLHLYGKRVARVGRKMGHLSAVAVSADEAARRVLRARAAAVAGVPPALPEPPKVAGPV